MVDLSFEEIIEKIMFEKKISRWKLLELIEKKKAELGGLITDKSAAMLVAKELGLNFFNKFISEEKINISKLKPGMRNVTLIGRVSHIFPVREFTVNNKKNEVVSLILYDGTGEIRVVLWDTNHIKLIKEGVIKRDCVLRVIGADVREGRDKNTEVHVGSKGNIIVNPEDVDLEKIPKIPKRRLKIRELDANMYNIVVCGVVKRIGPLTSFEWKDRPGKILSLILGDETGEIRVVFWNEKAEEATNLKEGDVIELSGVYTKLGRTENIEIHVDSESGIRVLQPEEVSEELSSLSHITEDKFMSITNLTESSDVNVEGIVARIESLREFVREDGSIGKRLTFVLSDENGNTIRVVAWNDAAEQLSSISEGDALQIFHGYVKRGLSGNLEVHIGKLSTINVIKGKFPSIAEQVEKKPHLADFRRVKLQNVRENERIEVKASVTYFFDKPLMYDACPDCLRKVELKENVWICHRCGKEITSPIPRLTLTCIIDDGSDTIIAKCWNNVAAKLLNLEDDLSQVTHEELLSKINDILGREFIFRGNIVYNDVSNRLELNVLEVENVDPVKEAEKLLEKIKKAL